MLLDGTEGGDTPTGFATPKMMDNITVTKDGKVLIQEDVGNQAHLGKIWMYDPTTDALTLLAQHDPARFTVGGADFLTTDEEASGIIDVTDILGSAGQHTYLLDVQAHYNSADPELVQGGQLLLMHHDIV